jgi:hypothetical protein
MAAAESMVSMRESVASRLRSMLPQSATGPMEDHDLMALEFKAQHFLVSAHIPSYAEWFPDCYMEPTYRYERRVFKLLQWKWPPTHWWLKSPGEVGREDRFFDIGFSAFQVDPISEIRKL